MAIDASRGVSGGGRVAERLASVLARRVGAADAIALGAFATQLLARAQGYADLLGDEELAQLVLSAFRFFQAPGALPRVRVLTPTYVDEGWDAPGTVIETAIGDRPFVVDTVREELRARGIEPRALLHPILAVTRDATGRAERVEPPMHGAVRESFLHVLVPRIADASAQADLADALRSRLDDVVLVTEDFGLALARAQAIATELEELGRARDPKRAAEATAVGDFLRWLVDGGFVFLGYREYAYTDGAAGRAIAMRPGTGLGLMRREERSAFRTTRPLADLPAAVQRRASGARLFTVAKTRAVSPVHRRVRMDDLGFPALDAAGRIVGERRFIGLFTSKAHAEEASEVPVLRRMLRQILVAEGVVAGGHDWKEIVGVFNTLPKALLFASTPDEIRAEVATILAAERARDVVVSVAERGDGDLLSIVVVMPRRQTSGEARARVIALVREGCGVDLMAEHVHVGAGDLADARARLHLVFERGTAPLDGTALASLRDAIAAALESWPVRLRDALLARHGAEAGARLAARFAEAFPPDYQATTSIERAAADAELASRAAAGTGREIALDPEPQDGATVLRLYLAGTPLVLADFLPVLDHVGVRTLGEDRVRLDPPGAGPVFLHRFLLHDRHGRPLDVPRVGARLVDALVAVGAGRVADDVLNALVVTTDLDWRAVDTLRAYAGYAVQAGLGTRAELWSVLARNPEPARALYAALVARFGPGAPPESDATAAFVASLEAVEQLRDDQRLRGLAALVAATVRTNVFSRPPTSDRIVLKLRSADVPFLPEPRPRYEIYVQAPVVEGLHLRAGAVARGGIRLSDRPEDYRTEVLGLMRTQTMKNAIIVPTGAKGAFVPRRGAAPVEAYREFIRGLLDVTDDVVGDRVVHPAGLRLYDEEDPYLVVAADKGTATFSDDANAIAVAAGFWLGDAFASGGSHGYDHKALGITARGAWECVRTHFRELDVDADTAPLRTVGIGDMGGDVFGNGLLRSPHLRLVAAFDHRHVFLDPEPDPAASFAERRRLFAASAGWDQYDPAVRSPGALVVARAAKRVLLTPEVQRLLGTSDEALSGEALVRAVLGLEADLLWNGGIGTYVRAPDESDAGVGDPANDAVRVTSVELRVRVVAEGGNLGLTQRARVAFALAGGRLNMDAVDNSAGVDMSDHEVNLKVALAPFVAAGRVTVEARNALLAAVEDDVAAHVLAHNTRQSRLLAVEQRRSETRLADFRARLAELERAHGVARGQLDLPDWETLRARRAVAPGLTRPELAVVVAYTKIELQEMLRASDLPDDPGCEPFLFGYFPGRVVAELPEAVRGHRLRREIVVVELVNALVDALGSTFVSRLERETGARPVAIVRAWAVAWQLVDGASLAAALAGSRPLAFADAIACSFALEDAFARLTRWILAHEDGMSVAQAVAHLAPGVDVARSHLPNWLTGTEASLLERRRAELELCGLDVDTATRLATLVWLPAALDVVTLAADARLDVHGVAQRYFALATEIDFGWLAEELGKADDGTPWERRARESIADDVRAARRALAREPGGPRRAQRTALVRALVDEVKAGGRATLPALVVVAREIRQLAEAGE